MKKVYELKFEGRTLKVEVGELAKQANGSALIRYEDTVILSSACASKVAKTGIDFFPLTVTFEEKLYSVGKIPGSFLRREGRPSEHAILTARLIDRPIRPFGIGWNKNGRLLFKGPFKGRSAFQYQWCNCYDCCCQARFCFLSRS